MPITPDLIKQFESDFSEKKENTVFAHAIARVGLEETAFNNSILKDHNFIFSDETKRGEITSQKSSGRCWMFAALNAARINVMEKLNLETFEFSQNYTLFWDKLEKSNYFLENILQTLDEPLEGRLLAHLLKDPIQDGGQWEMFSGLLEKYGSIPKYMMPETFHSSNTRDLNTLLTHNLRKFAQILRTKKGKDASELLTMKNEFLSHMYNLLVKALGTPPTLFDFEYRDKDKKFHKIEKLTPQSFFSKYVGWKLKDKVSLINAPTKDKPYGKTYTVKFLGTIKEANPVLYINVPIEVLKESAIKSIKAGEAVWFGCDVGKLLNRKEGLLDSRLYNYDTLIAPLPEFTKEERLDYGESMLTHAMVFTGVDLDNSGKPIKWQVENSWGEDYGKKGIFSMNDAWFEDHNYQIMVDKKYIDAKWLKALEEKPIELEPWDPMGALALMQ